MYVLYPNKALKVIVRSPVDHQYTKFIIFLNSAYHLNNLMLILEVVVFLAIKCHTYLYSILSPYLPLFAAPRRRLAAAHISDRSIGDGRRACRARRTQASKALHLYSVWQTTITLIRAKCHLEWLTQKEPLSGVGCCDLLIFLFRFSSIVGGNVKSSYLKGKLFTGLL